MEARKCLVAGGNLLQAHTWKGLLEAGGIVVELRGEALMGGVGELPVDLQTVELWVDEQQLDAARQQLAQLEAQQPQWQCVQCQEFNEASFELCWQCSAERCEQHNE
ncbi:zinc-finger-like domain-containing protein [Shewanella sp. NFH-SH190041]|uniref:putative signal transducing protein n=1 Tax=Shewanella sp. NFH-SH190041 TaxID=2950245 RepID=UPI0021C39574|nr:DUF2007 domain-containing protein [Shewanella sp. NFH-SH190041]BDM63848.1 zinc-finger-like domain-containing protein [Shewanella sp. NFH-SH190041]